METMQAIIDNCKKAKLEKGYSYEYIAEQSGIPKSTVERFFGNKGTSCRYDTIYPIVRFLMDFDEPTPTKNIAAEMPLPVPEMIDWYKEVILKREAIEAKMKEEHKTEIAELKAEHRQNLAELKSEHTKSKRGLTISLIITLLINAVLLVLDTQLSGVGWFR